MWASPAWARVRFSTPSVEARPRRVCRGSRLGGEARRGGREGGREEGGRAAWEGEVGVWVDGFVVIAAGVLSRLVHISCAYALY